MLRRALWLVALGYMLVGAQGISRVEEELKIGTALNPEVIPGRRPDIVAAILAGYNLVFWGIKYSAPPGG